MIKSKQVDIIMKNTINQEMLAQTTSFILCELHSYQAYHIYIIYLLRIFYFFSTIYFICGQQENGKAIVDSIMSQVMFHVKLTSLVCKRSLNTSQGSDYRHTRFFLILVIKNT